MIVKRWYVIRTKPHSESLAASTLQRQGYELFYPRVLTPKAKLGAQRLVPLFPGYLFLRCAESQVGWPQVQLFPGVSGWVRFEGVAPLVPDEVVGQLAQRVKSINTSGGLWRGFKRGDRVRMVSGKVESLAEVVEEAISPQARVRVLMEFLGRLVSVKVPWEDLYPVSDEVFFEEKRRAGRRTRGRGRWIQGFGPRAVASA